MADQDYAALARTIYEAFNDHDFDACLEIATDDIEVVGYAFGESTRGKDAFRNWLERWKTFAPDGRVEVVSQLVGSDGITNENRFVGTNTGPLPSPTGEIPATGQRFDAPFIEVWRFRDGKVASLHNYSDTLTLLTQLGLAPAPEQVQA
jgi:steroid delta-isomerase-like uncharacterized protein